MGFSRLFRSRWSALFWAGGVLWTAYGIASANAPDHHARRTVAPTAVVDATGTPVDKDDLAVLANAMND